MSWNFHRYYTNTSDGLISKLKLSSEQTETLKALRKCIRTRTKAVFEEAKGLVRENGNTLALNESIKAKVAHTRLAHLSPEAQDELILLITNMSPQAREAFLALTPRFWTQGSFQYDTLNMPYSTPPQEMDIDDGTYLPMAVFDDRPVIGHRLLILLVDSSLRSFVAENESWRFETKRTCARIRIPEENTHIDVPMYAIPEEQFLLKEVAAFESRRLAVCDSASAEDIWENDRDAYELDSDSVNLALRDGEEKWMKSDPKTVEDWFLESCRRSGFHLKKICRYLKAWRDAQWSDRGPSSISLMAAAVSILNKNPYDSADLGATMLMVAHKLPDEFSAGVESPDPSDEKPLFPPAHQHEEWERGVMVKLRAFSALLIDAENAISKDQALTALNKAYGERVTKSELIDTKASGPAFTSPPSQASQPKAISKTMSSG